ncbi:MAG TPA: hypothetical protein VLJ21_04260, partial [Candidatus Binatia bacterium]|nr:hypothetical protein [Candidatus Binatia bacterium]
WDTLVHIILNNNDANFTELPAPEFEPAEIQPPCCGDMGDVLRDLNTQVQDLQVRLDAAEDQLSRTCESDVITSGSCDTACKNKGLKCIGSVRNKWISRSGSITADPQLPMEVGVCWDYVYYSYSNNDGSYREYQTKSCLCC